MTKSVRDVSFHANIIEKNVMLGIINIIIDVTFFWGKSSNEFKLGGKYHE